MQLKNRISENPLRDSTLMRAIRLTMIAGCFTLLWHQGEAAGGMDELTIGIIQFPSTLNPNIDVMAAKNYVLGAVLRPFTVYDAEWKLVCLLCVSLPSIEGGGAVAVDLPDGKKGIDMTFTIRPDANWGDGAPVTTEDVLFTYDVGRDPTSAVSNAEP